MDLENKSGEELLSMLDFELRKLQPLLDASAKVDADRWAKYRKRHICLPCWTIVIYNMTESDLILSGDAPPRPAYNPFYRDPS